MTHSISSSTTQRVTIQRDCVVTLDYVLYDSERRVVHATDVEGGRPIRYVHGYGSLVPGLEQSLLGMAEGETQEIEVPPQNGYGLIDETLLFWVDRNELPEPIALEDEFLVENNRGEEISIRVVEINADSVLVDGNHPLAGKTLYFDVIIHHIRPATTAEIAEAKKYVPQRKLKIFSPVQTGTNEKTEQLPLNSTNSQIDQKKTLPKQGSSYKSSTTNRKHVKQPNSSINKTKKRTFHF